MVGITFCKAAQSGPYTVMEVSSQGAAHRSGLLKSGDLIQSIDQQSVYNLDSRQVSKLLVGPPGSTVSLVISSQWAEA
jgi:C-terminal processing protease CtpA/Prc